MFKIGDTIIPEDIKTVILALKSYLDLNGKEYFSKIIEGEDNLQTICPYHKGGKERKPSFGIRTTGRDAGTCHCFTCGWTGSIQEVISHCLGYDDLGLKGTKWIFKNFLTMSTEKRKDIELNFESQGKQKIEYISESELNNYRVYHPYMWERKLTPEIVEMFDVGFDKDSNCLTFPVRDLSGGSLFVARRSVNSKYFNYPNGVEKPIYGIYELSLLKNNPSEIIVCESIINALTCWVYGKAAVALNGTGTKSQIEQLKKLHSRKLILGLDPDSAGIKGSDKIKNLIKNKIITMYEIPVGKDINDLSLNEFKNLREYF